jgi:hypothetical protein
MRLPGDPRDEARRLIDEARLRFRERPSARQGLQAFDDVPCARIPVWRSREARADGDDATPRP